MTTAARFFKRELLPNAFPVREGFHRADWEQIGEWIEGNVAPQHLEAAWHEAVSIWLDLLRQDLGGSYVVSESADTILLCGESKETIRWLLDFTGRADRSIRQYLGPTAWKGAFGKNVLLVFSDQQTYYNYVSYHCGEAEEQAASGGMCIYSDYTHVAMPWIDQLVSSTTIMHELAHSAVVPFALPRWLNEGIALTMENTLNGWMDRCFVPEELERHFDFWNEENIQAFWAGASFLEPGDANELSYALAFILMKLLSERSTPDKFTRFVEAAHWDDAGQGAALSILSLDLGELAGTFLGPGNWRPNPDALGAHFSSLQSPE